jgi:thiosulfate/3-mercaptopyruvate sulfurtransferase
MQAINVRKSDYIVVYDKIGKISAPRAYWILKTFGLQNVAILNGSFSKWVAENRQIEDGDLEKAWKKIRLPESIPLPEDFNFSCDKSRVRYYDEIVKISNFNLVASDTNAPDSIKIIDTRLDTTFALGHIPSSINIPFT